MRVAVVVPWQRCACRVYLNFRSLCLFRIRFCLATRSYRRFVSLVYFIYSKRRLHHTITCMHSHTGTTIDIIHVVFCFSVLHVRRFIISFFFSFFVSNLGRSTLGCICTRTHPLHWSVYFIRFVFFASIRFFIFCSNTIITIIVRRCVGYSICLSLGFNICVRCSVATQHLCGENIISINWIHFTSLAQYILNVTKWTENRFIFKINKLSNRRSIWSFVNGTNDRRDR